MQRMKWIEYGMTSDPDGFYVPYHDALPLEKRVKELEAALAHIDACCYGSEMLDWTSQLNVTKNLVNIHIEATAALEAPHEP